MMYDLGMASTPQQNALQALGGCVLLLFAMIVGCVFLVTSGGDPADRGRLVRASDDTAAWPFTFSQGTITCQPESRRSARRFVTIDVGGGIEYGLNGSAIGFGFPDGRRMLKPDKTPADIQPLIDIGLALCDE